MKKYLLLAFFMLSTTFYAADKTESSKLDDVLATVVEKGLALAEQTGTFVIEQAPDLIQQFYQWHMYSNIFYILIGIIIIIFGTLLSNKFKRYVKADYLVDDPGPFFTLFFSILIGGIFVFTAGYDLIYLISAPKLYLIEYFVK